MDDQSLPDPPAAASSSSSDETISLATLPSSDSSPSETAESSAANGELRRGFAVWGGEGERSRLTRERDGLYVDAGEKIPVRRGENEGKVRRVRVFGELDLRRFSCVVVGPEGCRVEEDAIAGYDRGDRDGRSDIEARRSRYRFLSPPSFCDLALSLAITLLAASRA